MITIFTPTFNRAYLLTNLYNSIKRQDYKNFEWIIVDDGSTDNTKELINKWIKENIIDIKYYYQENSGKHIAINNGIEHATGELFVIVDSDDILSENALTIISNWHKTLINNKEKFAGIGGLKAYKKGGIIGTTFTGDFIDATQLERNKYNIKGDKAEVFYTKVLKKYKFPKIENEKFISEAYIWNKIAADGYKIRWFNDVLIHCEYIADGLSKNRGKIEKNNPKGYLLYLKDLIKYEKNLFRKLAHYTSYCNIANNIYSTNEIKKQLKISKLMVYLMLFLGKIRRCFF